MKAVNSRPGLGSDLTRPASLTATVVVPTYNEAENISRLVPELLALRDNLTVIVVDDASPDGTGKLVDAFAHDFPERVFPLHRAAKLGLGTAYLAGFQAGTPTYPYLEDRAT